MDILLSSLTKAAIYTLTLLFMTTQLMAAEPMGLVYATGTPLTDNRPQPIEKTIGHLRKQQGDIIVQQTRLTKQDGTLVRLVDYIDDKKHPFRVVVDAMTGKVLTTAPLKDPVSLEKVLTRLKNKHNISLVLRSWLEQLEGQTVRVVEFIDNKSKRWRTSVDAYTGKVIDEINYTVKPTGKLISLQKIIASAKANHKSMIILKTRLSHRKGVEVREIIYLDDSKQKKRLIINALTGEVIEDKTLPIHVI